MNTILEKQDQFQVIFDNTKKIPNLEELQQKKEYWDRVLYRLDIYDAKILRLFYYPKPTAFIFNNLVKLLKNSDMSKTSIWRKINKLNKFGLIIKYENSKPLCLASNHKIINNTLNLVKLLCGKFGLEIIK